MILSKWIGYFGLFTADHLKRRTKYIESPDWQLCCCIDDMAIQGEMLSSLSDSFYMFIEIADQLQPSSSSSSEIGA